jgi:hypothetical protein
MPLSRGARQGEFHAGFAIHGGSGREIDLIDWNFAAPLVEDGERRRGHQIVVNLHWRTAVFEYQRDRGFLNDSRSRGWFA